MIQGHVNPAYEAVIMLTLRSHTGSEREIEVVIDTGYNGFLSLPPTLVEDLELPLVGPSEAMLANGLVETFNVHDATVLWDGMPRDIEADAVGPAPLAGMLLPDGYNLNIAVQSSGPVVIDPLS